MSQDQRPKLEALARLANVLASATVEDPTVGVNTMAKTLTVRLETLAEGVRLAQATIVGITQDKQTKDADLMV